MADESSSSTSSPEAPAREPLAVVDDLPSGLRPAAGSAERGDVDRLLRRASALVRSRVPRIDERVSAGEVDRDLVAGAVADMVTARLSNPELGESVTSATGPFSETVRFGSGGGAAVGMTVPQWLLDALRPASDGTAPGAVVTAPGVWGQPW